MSERSATLALMREYSAPLTRDEYLKWNNLGKTYEPSPEEEAEMPEQFQLPDEPDEAELPWWRLA
jgi:hypothetical protein